MLAQDEIRISGTLLDQKTKIPLVYAAIQVKGSPLGTSTDFKGRFNFTISDKYRNDTLLFSIIGYFPKTLKISSIKSGERLTVYMKQKSVKLDEITVKPKKAIKLIKEALKRIPENYHTEPIYLDAYVRDICKIDSTYIKYADAAVQYYYEPLRKKPNFNKDRTRYNDGWSWFKAGLAYAWIGLERGVAQEADQVKLIASRANESLLTESEILLNNIR